MRTLNTTKDIRMAVSAARMDGRRVALVPTMGNLHEGHLTLVDLARKQADLVICSIFVNPTQFGPDEDYDAYPRTLEEDSQALAARGCDLIFAPSASVMYPRGLRHPTRVSVSGLTDRLCGASRPGHFDGVATVVTILFNLVQPDLAVFGEKDFQQLQVIRRFSSDLHLPVQILGAPIVRHEDGLAMSSRNRYLSTDERSTAPELHQTLIRFAEEIASNRGQPDQWEHAREEALSALRSAGFEPDYLHVLNETDLAPADPDSERLRAFVAARLGRTRLIDNCPVAWE